MGLTKILSDQTGSGKSKMAACGPKVHTKQRIPERAHMIITTFQRRYLCFRGCATQLDQCKHCRVSGRVRNRRWRPVTGRAHKTTCISACTHDGIQNPTATPMLSRSRIMTALVRILSYVRVSGISKKTAYNRKCLPESSWIRLSLWFFFCWRTRICR